MQHTLAQLQAMPIVGNHHQDSHVFRACRKFILDPNTSMAEKIEAMNVIHKAMGEPQKAATENDVEKYIEEVS